MKRPHGVFGLCCFFLAATAMCLATSLSLGFPGTVLDGMWRLKPASRADFVQLGAVGPPLFFGLAVLMALAGVGLWRGRRWGWLLAIALLSINLLADAGKAIVTGNPDTAIGVPIAAALISYLVSPRVRRFLAERAPS
jgi:uncharacterized membrane protein (DUF2068 family)